MCDKQCRLSTKESALECEGCGFESHLSSMPEDSFAHRTQERSEYTVIITHQFRIEPRMNKPLALATIAGVK